MISIEHLSKKFGNAQILKDISLRIQDGEVVAILGPSGTGKTTLLRSINFLNEPDCGIIALGTLRVDARHRSKKDVLSIRQKTAMVFQHYNLFQNKTVLENVTVGLTIVQKKSREEAEDIALEELRKVGMEEKKNAYPGALSGGQQQRVGIARALALKPEVVLFDEPTSALDPENVGEVLSIIRDVAGTGNTMMIVTHEIGFARSIANRVIFMDEGRIVEDGKTREFFSNPREQRTKEFLQKLQDEYAYNF